MKHDFIYGTQYYRDPTPLENEWDDDLEGIKQINMDTVQLRLNWRYFERKENEYDFAKVDRLLKTCKEHGMKVIVKFMLECAPQYVFEKYNGTRVNIDGSYIRPGSHGAFYGGWRPCFTNEKVMERAVLFVKKLTEHIYKDDSIVLYNVWNEIRNKPLGECFCPECRKAFGNYLENKFGTIEKLNEYYGTAEESFETINLPSTPHGYWDLFEFKKFKGGYELKNWLDKIYSAVKSIDKNRPIMAHVGICAAFQHCLDDVSDDTLTRQAVDFFGTSIPCDTTMDTEDKRLEFLMLNDYMRAVDENYVIHEVYPGLGMFKLPYDTVYDMDFKLYAALASGVKGITYWQYRAERLGVENDCAGLAGMDGEQREVCKPVSEVGKLIKEDGELLNNSHKKQAEVAIVYDFDSQLISEIEDICGPDFKFDDWGAIKYYRYAHAGFYRMLTKLNYDVDYVLSCDLDKFDSYKVLYFPYHNMLKEKTMKAIEKFVKNGGTVILDEGFGMRDENTWMNPYDLKVEGMFKARYDKRRRVYGEVTVNINNEDIRVYPYTNIYKNNNGEAILKFSNGSTALSKYQYGKGTIYLAGFSIGFTYSSEKNETLASYIDKILNNSGVNKNKYGDFAKGLIVRELVNEKGSIFFYMNTSEEEQDLTIDDNKILVPAKKNGYIKLN